MKQQAKIKDKGFTLIELMVAMVVAIIVIGAIYAVYQSQTRVQVAQEVTLELQESLRAALSIMGREIRTAGADPTGNAGARILRATANELWFTRNVAREFDGGPFTENTDSANPAENIRYKVMPGQGYLGRDIEGNDNDGDLQPLLERVAGQDEESLNFVYLDSEGNRLDPPDLQTQEERNQIRQIQVTIVAESEYSDRGLLARHTDAQAYENQKGEEIFGPANDNARRLMMTNTITCRNMPK